MKKTVLTLLSIFAIPAIAGGLTISTLPAESEEPNPVCRDSAGKLTNCTPNAGVDGKYLVPIVVDGDNIELGTVFTATRSSWTVLTDKGYLFELIYRIGDIAQPAKAYYDEIDCGGNGYPQEAYSGYVFESPTYGNQIVYIPWDATRTQVEINSLRDSDWVCHNTTFFPLIYIPIVNDPAVTGVTATGVINGEYTLPIVLQRP